MDDYQLLLGFLMAAASSGITQLAKRWKWADDLSRTVTVVAGGLCGALLWWLGALAGLDVGAFEDALELGLAAGGVGTGGYNALRKAWKSEFGQELWKRVLRPMLTRKPRAKPVKRGRR